MDKFEYVNIDSLSLEGEPEKSVGFKPISAPIIIGITGIILLFLSFWKGFNLICFILGLFVVLFTIAVVVFVKDRKVISFYKDGMLIYNSDKNDLGFFMPYSQMKEWTVKKSDSGCDAVWFRFADGRQIYKDSFQTNTIYNYLAKNYLNRESNQIRMKELRKKQLSIPEVIENIRKKLMKK